MSNQNDFVIENGVLKKYKGKDTVVVVPDGVTSIGKEAFSPGLYGSSNLTSVTLPEGLTSIGNSAFYRCKSLTGVTLPEGLTSIGNSAFEYCHSLTSVTLPEGLTSIGKEAFEYCHSLTSVTLPEGLTSIGNSAFKDCWSLTGVTLPEGLTSIGGSAFYMCERLTSVTLPEGLMSIGDEAFYGCENLTSVTMPEGLMSIGDEAFYGCENLTSVTMPEGLTSIGKEAFRRCKNLADANGFVILNGILFDYFGKGGDVTLPEGLTSIGDSAFYECESLTGVTLPEGLTSIGNSAFYGCKSLTNITLPEGLTSIGYAVFSGCESLTGVTLPEGLTSIGNYAFYRCERLTGVTLPEGLTSIGKEAFYKCESLTNVTLPEGLTSIGDYAFYGCGQLNCFDYRGKLVFCGKDFFGGSFPAGLIPQVRELYRCMKDGALKQYILTETVWEKLDLSVQKEIWFSRQSKALSAAYLPLVSPELAESIGETLRETLAGKSSVRDCNTAASLMTSFSGKVSPALLHKLYGLLQSAKNGAKALTAVEADPSVMELLKAPTETSALSPAEKYVFDLLSGQKLSQKEMEVRLKEFYGLTFADLPELKEKDGHVAAPFVFSCLLTAYEHYEKPGLCPEAAGLIELLDKSSLSAALLGLADEYLVPYQNTKKKYLAFPFCRYADEDLMRELCARAPKWATSVSGNNAPMLLEFRNAVRYSDTRAAMLFADRYHELEAYAALRGADADTLRDAYLSDVGLDETRGKAYDLGNQVVTARLQKDLSFLFELPNGKTAKSLPKKGADEAKYAAAKADFDAMRKSVKKILKNRADRLFEDFLSGRARDAAGWQDAYLRNPLLREAAGKLVWAQEKACFTLTDSGVVNSAGDPYTITEKPIRVAHPMEMSAAEAEAWRKYFSARGIRQPFEQVWEPVIDPADIKEDRYEGVEMWFRIPSGKQKHGVDVYGFHAYSEDFGIELKDCDLEYEASTWRYDPYVDDDVIFTLGKFTFPVYNRQVNHIVSLFDRWTVGERVKKDDVTVAGLLDGFTLAQITEFIAAAQEANATNILALLLEYKNTRFADFDPMAEFTLEW